MACTNNIMRLATLIIVLAIVSVTIAQNPPPPGQGGPGGPFGGRMGMAPSNASILNIVEVQEELKLTEQQQEQFAKVFDEMRQEIAAIRERMQPADPDDLSPEEMDDRMTAMRREAQIHAKKADAQIATILNADQLKRLEQLRLQREGIAGLLRDDIGKRLELTEQQAEQLRDLQEQGGMLFQSPEDQQKSQGDALAVLTDAQREKYAAMKGPDFKFPEPQFGGRGPGGGPGGGMGGGPGGGGPMQPERQLLAQFDKDSDGLLNLVERNAARAFIKANPIQGRGGRGMRGGPGGGPGGVPGGGPGGGMGGGPGGGMGGEAGVTPSPGPRVSQDEVKPLQASLYEPNALRTIFLDFEAADWDDELSDFYRSDVEVPATLTVDGKQYPNVGVRYRGASSYFTVAKGGKRSLNIDVALADSKQRVLGSKTLNLLNAHTDPTFLHTVLFFHIARQYIPAPKANFVRLVINGESWGVYVNTQQFDKEFISENYKSDSGARWKAPGSPQGRAGLEYLGDDIEAYKKRFEIKSADKVESWKALVNLCKVLNETPLENLEEALTPILDIEGVLWFLALDIALINSDGYWTRASDYCLYLDPNGKFHIIPHDANETLQAGGGGPGMGGRGMGGRGAGGRGGERRGDQPPDQPAEAPRAAAPRAGSGAELDPLLGMTDATKPLRSRLLNVPSLRARYLANVRTIAEKSLDWNALGPVIDQYRTLVASEIEADTRKLTSYESFQRSIDGEQQQPAEGRGLRPSLKTFLEQRRAYLLNYPEIKKAESSGEAPAR